MDFEDVEHLAVHLQQAMGRLGCILDALRRASDQFPLTQSDVAHGEYLQKQIDWAVKCACHARTAVSTCVAAVSVLGNKLQPVDRRPQLG